MNKHLTPKAAQEFVKELKKNLLKLDTERPDVEVKSLSGSNVPDEGILLSREEAETLLSILALLESEQESGEGERPIKAKVLRKISTKEYVTIQHSGFGLVNVVVSEAPHLYIKGERLDFLRSRYSHERVNFSDLELVDVRLSPSPELVLPSEETWHSVESNLPDTDRYVLVYEKHNPVPKVSFHGYEYGWGAKNMQVTFWAEIPHRLNSRTITQTDK